MTSSRGRVDPSSADVAALRKTHITSIRTSHEPLEPGATLGIYRDGCFLAVVLCCRRGKAAQVVKGAAAAAGGW